MRRRIRAVLVTVFAAIIGILVAGPAGAATGQAVALGTAPESTATSVVVVSSSPAQTSTVAPAATITCTLQVNYPHKSSHVRGSVNVTATITCTAPVSSLAMQVGLYRNGALVARNTVSNAGSAYLWGNAATPCVSATYVGAASGAIRFPPGFSPPTGSVYGQSPAIGITC
jgi:hypothetical protein